MGSKLIDRMEDERCRSAEARPRPSGRVAKRAIDSRSFEWNAGFPKTQSVFGIEEFGRDMELAGARLRRAVDKIMEE